MTAFWGPCGISSEHKSMLLLSLNRCKASGKGVNASRMQDKTLANLWGLDECDRTDSSVFDTHPLALVEEQQEFTGQNI
jgi:hypothetical protein